MRRIMNDIILVCFFLILSIFSYAQSQYPGQHKGKLIIADKVQLKAYSFDLQDVKLLNGPFRENMERDAKWLLSIENKRLLHSFRINAGIKTSAKALGGWEALDSELRGHTMGHVLSALSLMFVSSGDSIYKVKADSLVSGLAEVQKILNQDGYLSAYPQQFINRCIAGTGVWAPWYTLHKIFAGLMDAYLYANNQQALEVAKNMASWAYKRLSQLTPEQLTVMQRNEFGGINEAFYNLYAITGNKEDLKLADMFYHHTTMDPLSRQEDKVNKMHANTFVPKITGEARGYELSGDTSKRNIADFFWNMVIDHHTFATGGNDDKEHFFESGHQSEHLTGYTSETCEVYNMLKLTRHLFCWNADEKYADYYEQALYNHILGSQDPETGMLCYFMPLLSGSHKVYSTPTQSFWCCVGSGSENHAKYGEGIYYHNDKGIYVNLFIPSELNWKEKSVKMRMETKFPEDGAITLSIQSAAGTNMPIYVRYPSWAVSGAVVTVNGNQVKVNQKPGSYIQLNRKWKTGDRIGITYPMKLRLIATPDNPDKVAIACGPIVLAGELGSEGMVQPAPYSDPELHNDYYTYDYHIPATIAHTLALDKNNAGQYIKPVDGTSKLMFKIVNENITLEPLYKIHHQRYTVYWDLK